jgi:PAS domain S-box-containing protein
MATILIAEDRAADRQYLVTLLGYHGHVMLEAADGREALALVQSRRPHLVISDVLMATMDGYEFVRQMRAVAEVAATPVIFYTATYHEREARALAESCGVCDLITKPSEPEVILAKVDAVLGRRPQAAIAPPDPVQFHSDHLQLVNQKLSEKVQSLAEAEHRLSALVEIGRHFSAEHDPRVVLQHVCAAARDITFAKYAVLEPCSEDGAPEGTVFTSGVDADRVQDLSAGILGAAGLSPLSEPLAPVRYRHAPPGTEATVLAGMLPVRGPYLGVPIASAARVYGWLSLRDKLGADEFTVTDEQMAVTLGQQAGIAYENARLYADLQLQVFAFKQEVAERRRMEDRVDFTLAAARMGIGETDLGAGRVIWSESKAALFGIALGSFEGTPAAFYDLVHSEDRARVRGEFDAAVANGSHDLVSEFRTIWPDGTLHWVQERARISYDPAGRALSVLSVGLDVTDKKLLEAQFLRAQKMEALGMLAGGVAHDFNNLLTSILGFSELLTEQIGPDKPIGRDLREIMNAAQRGAALTRQLLAFSRKHVLAVTALDLNQVVRNLETMLHRLLGEHITIKTALADPLRPVMADATQLEQVLMNLCVNARDAMAQGGILTIETRNADLDVQFAATHPGATPGSYALLCVGDTGIGMSSEIQARIFEPFFTTKERGRGTGLGLAAVYGIVKQLDGYVGVETAPGHGTTFQIYLPETDRAIQAPIVQRAAGSPVGTETILVVEDEDGVRAFIRLVLQRFGYRVLEAPDAEAALTLLDEEKGPIHLLLTDVILPKMHGKELALRATRDHSEIQVLFMSGYPDGMDSAGGGLEPGVQLLEKPFTAQALLVRIRQLLGPGVR